MLSLKFFSVKYYGRPGQQQITFEYNDVNVSLVCDLVFWLCVCLHTWYVCCAEEACLWVSW